MRRPRSRRLAAPALAATAALALGGCEITGTAWTSRGQTASPYLSWKGHTAHLELLAGIPAGPGEFNFDGASAGRMTVTVPLGWTVVVTCVNYATNLSHSCNIVRAGSSKAAFPGSVMDNARGGLAPGKSTRFPFRTTRTGNFQIACLVNGHRDAGMWDRFDVRKGIGRPTIHGARRLQVPGP